MEDSFRRFKSLSRGALAAAREGRSFSVKKPLRQRCGHARQYDFTSALARHPWPIHIIEGDHDFGPCMWEYTRQWVSKIGNARLTVIRNAGHNPWIDSPDEFTTALIEALLNTTGHFDPGILSSSNRGT